MTEFAEDRGEPLHDTASRLEAGMAFHQREAFDQAEALYLAILADEPNHFPATHLLGDLKNKKGDFQSAAQTLQRALVLNPRSALAHLNLGISLWNLDRLEEALTHYRYSVRFNPANPDALFNCAFAFQALQQAEAALFHWNELLTLNPDHAAALLNRGMVLQDLKRPDEAMASFVKALALDPALAEILLTRAVRLNEHLRHLEALAIQDKVLEITPDCFGALVDRSGTLVKLGRPREALSSLDLALLLNPDSFAVLYCRATALLDLKRPEEALATCDRALVLQPDSVEANMNRSAALIALNRHAEALAGYDRMLTLRPEAPDILRNRGAALHDLGRHQEAIDSWDRALAVVPEDAIIHSGKIVVMEYVAGDGFLEHQQERRRYFEAHASRFASQATTATRDRDPSRRLVLGYVSADFKNHATASIFLPILQRHSKADFQVNCYSGVLSEDDWTLRCKECADVWRQTTSLSDEALDAQIREDGVDILIDLSGHTVGNRMLVFARKPAPIQVSGWGHGGGTGLPTVDYLFADPVAIPVSARPGFAEEIYDLPCHITFEAPGYTPPLVDLPALSRGSITFGCLNRYPKVTPAVERLWARILAAVPDARLLLKSGMFDDPKSRMKVLDAFAQLGVAQNRIELRGSTSRKDHMAAFGDVDITLDPFPQNGGISTLESLWMGTPVIAKLGNALGSRASGAILHALGLGDWVAQDDEGYLGVAVRKAADIGALAQFRSSIRSQIMASPAGNPDLYTRAVELAYRTMWTRWLEKTSSPAEGVPS